MTDTRQVLEEAWDTIARANGLAWATAHAGKFARFLDAEAWTDAALCLVPEGWWLQHLGHCIRGYRCRIETNGPPSHSIAAGFSPEPPFSIPALAITQAALRAKEAGDA